VHQIRVKRIEIRVEFLANTDRANTMQMCLKLTVGGLTVGPVSACQTKKTIHAWSSGKISEASSLSKK